MLLFVSRPFVASLCLDHRPRYAKLNFFPPPSCSLLVFQETVCLPLSGTAYFTLQITYYYLHKYQTISYDSLVPSLHSSFCSCKWQKVGLFWICLLPHTTSKDPDWWTVVLLHIVNPGLYQHSNSSGGCVEVGDLKPLHHLPVSPCDVCVCVCVTLYVGLYRFYTA